MDAVRAIRAESIIRSSWAAGVMATLGHDPSPPES